VSQTCLVLGSSGFIGSHIVSDLLNNGKRVIGVDIMSNERQPSDGRYQHFSGAISPELIQLILTQHQVDVVIYAAGRASVNASFNAPVTDHHENVINFFQVMDGVRTYSPSSFVIFLSSAAVYGNPGSLPVTESHPLCPISPYGFHKVQAENVADEFRTCFGIRVSVLRIFSCYGEGQRKLLLWDLCERANDSSELVLRGRGNESRDFIHVRDVAGFISRLIGIKDKALPVYNLASGEETSVREVATSLIESLGKKLDLRFEGKVNTGNPDNWRADVSLMLGTGFQHSTNIREGISRYAQWYLSQK